MAQTKNVNNALGIAVRNVRQSLGISQEELGGRCNLDRTYVSGIERGLRNPTVQTLWALAEGLGIKPSDLIKLTEEVAGGR